MCNIAGYVGSKAAAPILLDMMRREEGCDGGYYIGLATLHEGKLYYAKLQGSQQDLERETAAASLPGHIGIIHSRSNDGGDDHWAHPFLGVQGGEAEIAYVANGGMGHFAPRAAGYNAVTLDLMTQGYAMPSKSLVQIPGYHPLPDGSIVHMSELMCQLILHNIHGGDDAAAAMARAYCRIPGEIVGLLLSLAEPDSIAWSRLNMPMMVSFADHGAYLASTALAFPADAGQPSLLPACAAGNVFHDHFTVRPYAQAPARVAPLDARVLHLGYECLCRELQAGEKIFKQLKKAADTLFEPADCAQGAQLTYEVLYALQREGRLHIEKRSLPGARPDRAASKFYFSIH